MQHILGTVFRLYTTTHSSFATSSLPSIYQLACNNHLQLAALAPRSKSTTSWTGNLHAKLSQSRPKEQKGNGQPEQTEQRQADSSKDAQMQEKDYTYRQIQQCTSKQSSFTVAQWMPINKHACTTCPCMSPATCTVTVMASHQQPCAVHAPVATDIPDSLPYNARRHLDQVVQDTKPQTLKQCGWVGPTPHGA
jgi:hypothetical protein